LSDVKILTGPPANLSTGTFTSQQLGHDQTRQGKEAPFVRHFDDAFRVAPTLEW
jgi:hypothetical protein